MFWWSGGLIGSFAMNFEYLLRNVIDILHLLCVLDDALGLNLIPDGTCSVVGAQPEDWV